MSLSKCVSARAREPSLQDYVTKCNDFFRRDPKLERYQAPRVFQVIQIIGNVIVDCGTINASRKRCFYPLLAYAKVPLDDVKKIYNRHVQKGKKSFKARFLIKEGINNEDCYGKVFFLRRHAQLLQCTTTS